MSQPMMENSAELHVNDARIVIHVDELKKHYRRGKVEAVKGISFEVHRGRIFGLIGPDGAGKTSIMQILAGVLRANGGAASIDNIDVLRKPELVKARIGYMPQGLGLNLYDSLTVAENIDFFRDLRQVPKAEYLENRERLLKMTRLAPFLERPAGKLSGGMRQKLALICTLIHLPDILLLDEPTTGVDPISRREFWTIIHELVTRRKVTVLLNTSYMDEAERCHRVALIYEGQIIAEGTPEKLTKRLPGKLLTVRGAAPGTIIAALRNWQGAESVALFGSDVHVLLKDSKQALSDQLVESGLDTITVQEISAGLEDVFVHQLVSQNSDDLSLVNASGRDTTSEIVRTNNKIQLPVQTEGLSCHFGDFVAVDNVSLSVKAGEIFGLLGPNGAGKTTLIKMLCGLQLPSEGKASVAGLDVRHQRDVLRENIGYMAQQFSLYRDLRVDSNLELYAGLYGLVPETRNRRIPVLLNSLGLAQYIKRVTGSLPLGLRQRLALACALIHEPPVLFLDEPTSGVDPVARRQFWDHVHLLAQEAGVSVLISTHYMDEAEHCDRLGLMQAGKLVAVGSPAQLRQQAEAQRGPIITINAQEFAAAFECLHDQFRNAMLYGRRIQWQSGQPDKDITRARLMLEAAGISADIKKQTLTMEETFVSYMEETRV
jgi:ABC-2 type transport system ATP-binding protein